MHAAEIREDINKRIIASLEAGVRPWIKPWSSDPNRGFPASFATRKNYQGINPILLGLIQDMSGYEGRWWGTFPQWKKLEAFPRKGERAVWVVLYKKWSREEAQDDGSTTTKTIPIMRMFPVFNISQLKESDGIKKWLPDRDAHRDGTPDFAEAVVVRTAYVDTQGIKVKTGNRASWNPQSRNVTMPARKRFTSEAHYVSTFFHELSHDADNQLGAKLGSANKRYGSEDYCFAELVAEISAAYLAGATDIPAVVTLEDSASYLDHWVKQMGKDPAYIMKAAARASQAADYILSFSRKEEEQAETEVEES